MREAVGIVETEKDVGEGKFEGICTEVLARPAGYDPFLSRAILGPIEHYVSVNKVIVQAMKVVLETHDHITSQPGLLIAWRPMQESILIILAKPFSKPVKAASSSRWWCCSRRPHFAEVERQKPALCTMYPLFNLHIGILQEHLGMWCNIAPFWYRLKAHLEHANTMHESLNVTLSPLYVRSLAKGK